MRSLALLQFVALSIATLLCPLNASAESLKLPSSSSTFDLQSAEQSLDLCSKHFADKTVAVFRQYGLAVVAQRNYGKTSSDVNHTSAYTLGRGKVRAGGREREAFVLAVRGTDAAEWYSNFDFAPSRSDSAYFAESFLFSAQDIFLNVYPLIKSSASSPNPVILVCGHSRGAACANILGLLFDAMCSPSDVYVYTFATPATVRGNDYKASNIFNVINPCDCVPRLPLASWGYSRAGKDIILPADPARVRRLDDALASLSMLADDVESYYFTRHSILRKGVSDDGITVFQAFVLLSEGLSNLKLDSADKPAGFQIGALSQSASDFSPLFGVLQNLGADGGSGAKALLYEHLPDKYLELMKEYK